MRLAQSLYEAGAITYMRTDGVQMDMSAILAARDAIAARFSEEYRPEKPRFLQHQGEETRRKRMKRSAPPISPGNRWRRVTRASFTTSSSSARWPARWRPPKLERTTTHLARCDRPARAARDGPSESASPAFSLSIRKGSTIATKMTTALLPVMKIGRFARRSAAV